MWVIFAIFHLETLPYKHCHKVVSITQLYRMSLYGKAWRFHFTRTKGLKSVPAWQCCAQSEVQRPLPLNTFGMTWNTDCSPSLITWHQSPTSLMLCESGKPSEKSEDCYNSQGRINSMIMPMEYAHMGVMVSFPYTFNHIVLANAAHCFQVISIFPKMIHLFSH